MKRQAAFGTVLLSVLFAVVSTNSSGAEVISWRSGTVPQENAGHFVLRYQSNGDVTNKGHYDFGAARSDPMREAHVTFPRSERINPRSSKVLLAIQQTARRYQDDAALSALQLSPKNWAALFQALIKVESAYNPAAVSPKGATGLAQLMPATAIALRVDINDPAQNLDGGARYLLAQLDRFDSMSLALAAYNAGPEAVQRHGGIPPYAETQAYVRLVLTEYGHLLTMSL